MPLFKIDKQKLELVNEQRFDLEKDIQKITEQNLEKIFNLKFVSGYLNKEFCVKTQEQDFYIDTLGFDEESKSPVIIEYKRDRSFSIIDQGFAYLSAMLNNKAEFILEINEKLNKNFAKKDIDWEQSRIIFISKEFTNYQKNAINFKDLPMYLYEVKLYKNGLIDFNPIKPFRTSESINKFIKDENVQKVTREVKVYTVDYHLKNANQNTKKLFELLNEKILELDNNIIVEPKKCYIAYKINKNFVDITPMTKNYTYLRVFINIPSGKLNDPYKIARDLAKPKKIGHWGNGDYDVILKKEEDIEKVFELIKQSYKYNK